MDSLYSLVTDINVVSVVQLRALYWIEILFRIPMFLILVGVFLLLIEARRALRHWSKSKEPKPAPKTTSALIKEAEKELV